MENIFNGIFNTVGGSDITLWNFVMILIASIIVGLILSFAYMYNWSNFYINGSWYRFRNGIYRLCRFIYTYFSNIICTI